MEENKNKEGDSQNQSNNLTDDDSIILNSSMNEIQETNNKQQELTDNKTETKNMEVHHHPHTERKKFKHYLFEFFMLFLAVFCGFLAEYQLEHVIEHQKEKQYIESLISDLQDDVKSLDLQIDDEQRGIGELDSLIYLLDDAGLAKQKGDDLYYFGRMGPRSKPFSNNNRTFDQLRNSGGFRLIRKTNCSNQIMGYYGQFSEIRLLEDNYNHEFDNYKKVAAKIFDPGILRRQEDTNGEIFRSNDNPQLRTYDSELLKELSFHALQMNGSRRSRLAELKQLKASALQLQATLQKDYQLQ
ncbi:MAG: hypothetical protein JST34_09015 [Bacteroidetes bacterium]|nr:hypothetical protein [Bacteroidota bacterium]